MAVVFYDNREPLDRPGVADLDRIYCFDWDRFGDAEWAVLAEAYPRLPGWAGNHPVPCWFGTYFEEPPCLWASVEPPGLQIGGTVPVADWLAWEPAFGAAVAELPFRSLDEGSADAEPV